MIQKLNPSATYSNNQIAVMVYTDPVVNNVINQSIHHTYRDDFKSHINLIILEYDNKKLNKAIQNDYLLYLIVRIITNSRGDKSQFWKEFRNFGLPKSKKTMPIIDNINIEDNVYDIDADLQFEANKQKLETILNGLHFYYSTLFNLYREGKTYKEIEEITGIKYQSVRLAILKTIKHIQKELNAER